MEQSELEAVEERKAREPSKLGLGGAMASGARIFDERKHDEGLAARPQFPRQEFEHQRKLLLSRHPRHQPAAAQRPRPQAAHVEVPVERQSQGARDRGRGQHQHVRDHTLLRQAGTLAHAESMLLVDDRQAQLR